MLPAQARDLVRFRAVDEEEKREHPKFDPEGLAPVAERGTRFVSEGEIEREDAKTRSSIPKGRVPVAERGTRFVSGGEFKREFATAQVWVPELTPTDSFQPRTAGSPWENPDTDALTP
jgi:hypothetical protein